MTQSQPAARRARLRVLPATLLFALAACTTVQEPTPPDAAMKGISGPDLLAHIRTLASDEYEGRFPGTRGEQLTVKYIEDQFRALSLEPGNPGGTYLQEVPLVGITPDPSMALTFTEEAHPKKEVTLKFRDDFVAWTKRQVEDVSVDADTVFAGYGIVAPEYDWDDFKGADLKGKMLVVLVNDPGYEDQSLFGGKAMKYYGRWTYKYEKAAELGAAGCLIVHEAGPAGYPWAVVAQQSGEKFTLSSPDKNAGRSAVEGWITVEQARNLFKMAGKDFEALKKAALSRDFRPVPLGLRSQLHIHNSLREIQSANVVAKLTGSDPKLNKEFVVYTAHWDHFGIGPPVNGDKIYHGALDNASGVGALIEIAKAFKQLQVPPRRSILFLSVTAEEQGLLGSQYYAEHPLYPLVDTAVDINMDVMNALGRTRDIVMIGRGNSTLDEVVDEAAHEQGRTVKPDLEPEKGFFYRSDHFNFAHQGVPAFDPKGGVDYIGRPEGWGLQQRQRYTREDYHRPSDNVKSDWDLSGAVEDMQLYFLVGYRVANERKLPSWKPGAEFKAKREAMLRAAGKLK
ncbi:MAG TPA: M28 family metallopeptidase [Candidatus Acidoferrales bacterium]|nr:M28 family metallopeptidase [Candidatus Acidoferrales bacterium]